MWKRWALVSCFIVLAMTSVVLFSYESTTVSGFQRVNLTRHSTWSSETLEGRLEQPVVTSAVNTPLDLSPTGEDPSPSEMPTPVTTTSPETVAEVEPNVPLNNTTPEENKEIEPSPDETSPDEPSPDETSPDEPSPDETSPDERDEAKEEAVPDDDEDLAEPSPDESDGGDESPVVVSVQDEEIEIKQRMGKEPFLGGGVRGFVVKRGMVPPHYFASWSFEDRKRTFERWLNAYKNGNLVSHAPTPYPHCQVYINHHYKFIWIKGHKVGSTSMRKPLGYLCDDHWRVAKDANFDHCSHGVFNNKTLTTKDIKKWWKEYFVFGFVRNPYTRFASAEEYIGKMIPGGCGKPTFEQTCREPYIHTRLCKVRQCCWKGSVSHHYRHFMDQSSCLFTDMLTPAVDFIGEVENIHDDFQSIIDEINKRRDPDLPELKNDLRKTNSHGRRLQEQSYAYRLFKNHKFCLKTISQFYNKDFMLLDYERLADFET